MYQFYLTGKSLMEVGERFGMTRQAVYAGFKVRGFDLRAQNKRPFVIYDGKKFTLRNVGYYAATVGSRPQLHRYKYEKEIGVIPNDWDIHHIDNDKTNNHIDNLVAMPKSVHASLFNTGGNQYGKGNRQHQGVGERERAVNYYIARKHDTKSGYQVEGRS